MLYDSTVVLQGLMPTAPKRSCCLVVPLYRPSLLEDEALSLVMTHARAADVARLTILHPPENAAFVDRLSAWFALRSRRGISFHGMQLPSQCFSDLSSYSKLLLSESFYRLFDDYEWLFIVQSDALLLSDQLEAWLSMSYSYVGAPWFVGLDHPSSPLRPLGGGNGGFSLRRIADCIEVLRFQGALYPYLRTMELTTLPGQRWRAEWRALRRVLARGNRVEKLNLYEDLFWSFVAPAINPKFTVAPFEVSSAFAMETEPRFLFQRTQSLPLGCHAFRRYDPVFWDELSALDPGLIRCFSEAARELMAEFR